LAEDRTSPTPVDLVFALGHEIANLLAATRMHTHLIDSDTSPAELANVAATIGELSSRMGSLLSQIGPLLSSTSETPYPVNPAAVLDGLQRDVDESCDERVHVDTGSAAGLPSAAIDSNALHHILLTLIYQALEESEPAGSVGVAVSASGGSLVFTVSGESPIEEDVGAALRGRTLAHAVAEAILRERGGQIETRSSGDDSRVEVTVRAALV
jgi:signal transduction histidine kinase